MLPPMLSTLCFAVSGVITYAPMEGYGYGDAESQKQLPSSQDVANNQKQQNPQQQPPNFTDAPPPWPVNRWVNF